jgi:hypothetical protein
MNFHSSIICIANFGFCIIEFSFCFFIISIPMFLFTYNSNIQVLVLHMHWTFHVNFGFTWKFCIYKIPIFIAFQHLHNIFKSPKLQNLQNHDFMLGLWFCEKVACIETFFVCSWSSIHPSSDSFGHDISIGPSSLPSTHSSSHPFKHPYIHLTI